MDPPDSQENESCHQPDGYDWFKSPKPWVAGITEYGGSMSEFETNPEHKIPLSDKEQLVKLYEIATSLLESQDRQYLDELDKYADIEEVTFYIAGRLQELGHDFEVVFENAGLI